MENKIICMRGHAERTHEVRSFFIKNKAHETCEYSFNIEECIYYIDPVTEGVQITREGERAYNNLLPHLTELPPLEEKVEEVEFWLKPLKPVVVRDEENDYWSIDIFRGHGDCEAYPFGCMNAAWSTCLPFNKDTEKLVNTQDNPKTKYVCKGIKRYFDEE